MCGIVGVCNLDGEPVALPLLKRMTDIVAHRGPDGEGHYTVGGLGFGHRRLAIIDLTAAGHQPMASESGQVVIVYNGEIYNYQNLRVELESLGHRFHSKTDTEVVIHAYKEWGEAAVDRFNGMFAFAIWDSRKHRLFAARDRFGVKPFYYWWNGRQFVFGSEIKSILLHPDVPRRVSESSLNEYFTFQNILTDATLFDGIRLLPAGCWLSLAMEPAAPLQIQRYWNFDFNGPPISVSRPEAAEELTRLFSQAVVRQLVSDVPIGAYLSGGLDSASITAVATRHLGRLTTFTCGFDLSSASGLELAFDERASAEMLSNELKTQHYEVVLHAGDMEHVMPELIWHLEDLRVGQCYPNYYVARLAGRFMKVVLSGVGGDELFAGYPWRYFRGRSDNGRHAFYHHYYDFWQRLVRDDEKARLFTPDCWARMDQSAVEPLFRQTLDGGGVPFRLDSTEACVNASLYFELKTFLHGLLVVEDKISMAHSLETRVPFLDNDLVDFALRLPVAYKLRHLDRPARWVDENEAGKQRRYELQSGDGKLILREAMARIIPQALAERVKQGFSAPDASWFRGESIDYISSLLLDRHARLYDFVAPAFITETLEEHMSGRSNRRLLIWSLLSFEWWLRKFFG